MERIYVKDIIDSDRRETFLAHAILECCSTEVIASMKSDPERAHEGDARYLEVECTMNGFPIELSKFLNHLEAQLDTMIQVEARDIVLNRLNEVTNALGDIEREGVGVIKKIIKTRLGVSIPEEW